MTSHIDNFEFRKVLLNELIDNENFSREVVPYIKKEYFTDKKEATIWNVFEKFYTTYNKIPNRAILKVGLERSTGLTDGEKHEAKEIIDGEYERANDVTWLKDSTEEWCKLRSCVNAVIESMQILDGNSKANTIEAMPALLANAVSISFDKRIGLDYLDSAEERWEMYNRKMATIPSGIAHFDEALDGGFPKKALTLFMAGPGVGKSLTMCSCAAHAIKTGYDVLYITMEMAEEKISQRIDANLFNMAYGEIPKIDKSQFVSTFDKIKEKSYGRLIIKEYGTGSASSVNFTALLQELELKKNFRPQIIFVDYIGICASVRAGKGANSFEKIKNISEELRSIAMDYDIAMVSATQVNRDGINNTDPDMTNVSESVGLLFTADALIAMIASDEMRAAGMIKTIKLKCRFSDPNYKKVQMIGVNYSMMKLFDLEQQPAHIAQQNLTNPVANSIKTSAANVQMHTQSASALEAALTEVMEEFNNTTVTSSPIEWD